MKEISNELIVIHKEENGDELIKIIGSVPSENLDSISEFTCLALKHQRIPIFWGVVLNIVKEKGLITIGIKNTIPGEPIKVSPLLKEHQVLKYQKRGKVLPPLLTKSMQKVLITVDGFWVQVVPTLVNTLKKTNHQIIVSGPLTLKSMDYLCKTNADQIIPTDTFTALSQEILNSDADTLISLNTPLWQKKVTNLMWSHKVNKSLIVVNNQLLGL